jgi:hypothetical protein
MLQELHNSEQICSAWFQCNLVMVCLAWFLILMVCDVACHTGSCDVNRIVSLDIYSICECCLNSTLLKLFSL